MSLPSAGLKPCDHAPGLQRVRHQALVVEALFDHAVGLGEGVVDVAAGNGPGEGLIAAELFVQERRVVLERGLRGVNGVERVVVDLDEFGRVNGGIRAVGHDRRYGLPYEPHFAVGQNRMLRDLDSRKGLGIGGGAGNGADIVFEIVAGNHGDHARVACGGGGVDAPDVRVSVRAAVDGHMQRSWQLDVVYVLRKALDQPGIFPALDSGAYGFADRHGRPPFRISFSGLRTGRRPQCAGTRCSGRGCPRCRAGSAPRWAVRCAAATGGRR